MINKNQIKYIRIILQPLTMLLAILLFAQSVNAQIPNILRNRPGNISPSTSPNAKGQTKKSDSLSFQHRDDLADSITISFRFQDSLKNDNLDSSLDDFNKIYSVPASYVTLGNNGTAAFPVLFSPLLNAGWGQGRAS